MTDCVLISKGAFSIDPLSLRRKIKIDLEKIYNEYCSKMKQRIWRYIQRIGFFLLLGGGVVGLSLFCLGFGPFPMHPENPNAGPAFFVLMFPVYLGLTVASLVSIFSSLLVVIRLSLKLARAKWIFPKFREQILSEVGNPEFEIRNLRETFYKKSFSRAISPRKRKGIPFVK